MGLNKTQLVAAVAEETGLTKADASRALQSVMGAVTKELAAGGAVTLIGFGTFSVYNRAERMGKNPRSGASIKIPAKRVPKFKAGKALTEAVGTKKPAAKKKAKK
ncbi:MAG: histone-like DNA-binding protein [Ignavibacteria bacterium]|nr:histone-like DNA-binding protein [Ignavibacteria bacterium]